MYVDEQALVACFRTRRSVPEASPFATIELRQHRKPGSYAPWPHEVVNQNKDVTPETRMRNATPEPPVRNPYTTLHPKLVYDRKIIYEMQVDEYMMPYIYKSLKPNALPNRRNGMGELDANDVCAQPETRSPEPEA